MTFDPVWLSAAAAVGIVGGIVGAWFSVTLPAEADERGPPSLHRLAAFAAAGLLAGVWAALVMPGPMAMPTAAFGVALLLIAVVDGEHFWLPRALTVPLGLAGLIFGFAAEPGQALGRVIGAVVGFSFLALLALAYRKLRGREGLGGGDAWLLGALGAWVSWLGLPTVLLWACAAGLSWVVAREASGRGLTASDALPFGVYLAIGGWLTWLYGPLGF